VNKKFPYFEALQTFIRSTTNLSDGAMLNSLKRSGNVRLIVLSGLFTGAIETKVDLLVVGDRLEDRPARIIHARLEAELGRELRFASLLHRGFQISPRRLRPPPARRLRLPLPLLHFSFFKK
jgi:hypothetical protein